MNAFLNNALISLNTASMAQNIFLIIIEKHILMICISHQTIHLLFKYYVSKLGGAKACPDNADTGVGGGTKSGETC